MLAVLPFENLTAGDRYDYFSDGLTEEMITQLARLSPERLGVPDLIELTREPSFASLRSDAKFRELARQIGWHSMPAAD